MEESEQQKVGEPQTADLYYSCTNGSDAVVVAEAQRQLSFTRHGCSDVISQGGMLLTLPDEVGRCKLDPSLKAPCFQPLNPESAYITFKLNEP